MMMENTMDGKGKGCAPDAAIEGFNVQGFCLLLADYEATTSTPNECTDKTFIGYCFNDAALFLMSRRTMPGKTFALSSICPVVRAEPRLTS